jgi:hypothetical protein
MASETGLNKTFCRYPAIPTTEVAIPHFTLASDETSRNDENKLHAGNKKITVRE